MSSFRKNSGYGCKFYKQTIFLQNKYSYFHVAMAIDQQNDEELATMHAINDKIVEFELLLEKWLVFCFTGNILELF